MRSGCIATSNDGHPAKMRVAGTMTAWRNRVVEGAAEMRVHCSTG